MSALLAFLALIIERLAGYPDWLYRAIGHPVTWIGVLITRLDDRWNRIDFTGDQRREKGRNALIVLIVVAGLCGLAIQLVFGAGPTMLVTALVASALIAQSSLGDHVKAVATSLETIGLPAGRQAVSMIVGRDPDKLDNAGVCRAAIESLAENFSDGVVAPTFWMVVGGLPGAAIYKAVNTADSMIGHKNDRYLDFGRASARFDDLINLPASRLTAALVIVAALVMPGYSARDALSAVRRDARKHRSPNAGWAEAAFAGALGLGLNGPRAYGGVAVEDAIMNEGGRRDANSADIRRALRLYWVADALLIALVAAVALMVVSVQG